MVYEASLHGAERYPLRYWSVFLTSCLLQTLDPSADDKFRSERRTATATQFPRIRSAVVCHNPEPTPIEFSTCFDEDTLDIRGA